MELLNEIWQTARRNKLRTGLTGFAVAWGIFMLIVLLGAGNGLINAQMKQSNRFLSNSMMIFGGETSKPYKGLKEGRDIRLQKRDVETTRHDFADYMDEVGALMSKEGLTISLGQQYISNSLLGVYPNHNQVDKVEMLYGRFINQLDLQQQRKVIVLSNKHAQELLGTKPNDDVSISRLIGQYVDVGNFAFRVVGIYKEREDGRSNALTAFTTLSTMFGMGDEVGRIEFTFHGLPTEEANEEFEKEYQNIRGSKIGLIFQDPLSALNPIMKIGKQITEALKLSDPKISRADAKKKAVALMESVGITDADRRFDQYPFQFSGGMRQRIVIAIALAGNPEILICDEPTTALDVTVQARILELINKIRAERNLSVIFITHDMGVVAQMADRICVMYAGKVVETGTAEEIFFEPAHPYTWALLSSMPDLETKERLEAIPGTPPNMIHPPKGDAFAVRNRYALEIDYEMEPPMFRLSPTHMAATWLLHPDAPKVDMPESLKERIRRMKEAGAVE